MDETISKLDAAQDMTLLLGEMLGSRKAFSTIAGRSAAAEAECLRKIREERLFTCKSETWGEFCAKHIGMSKASANRIIRLLEEFGPDYFEMAQLTRITAHQYRAIAPTVRDHALHHNGEAIALIPANAEKIATVVDELRRAGKPEVKPAERTRSSRPRSRRARIEQLRKTAEQLAADFADLARTRSSRGDNPSLGDIRNAILSDLYQVDLIQ